MNKHKAEVSSLGALLAGQAGEALRLKNDNSRTDLQKAHLMMEMITRHRTELVNMAKVLEAALAGKEATAPLFSIGRGKGGELVLVLQDIRTRAQAEDMIDLLAIGSATVCGLVARAEPPVPECGHAACALTVLGAQTARAILMQFPEEEVRLDKEALGMGPEAGKKLH